MRASIQSAALLVVVGCTAARTAGDGVGDGDVGVGSPATDLDAATIGGGGETGHDAGTMPAEPGLELRVVFADGDAPPVPTPLPDKISAHIRIVGEATSADVVDAIFVFRVLDLQGNLLSSDHPSCRRFHVNEFGRIDEVLAGVDFDGSPCVHAAGVADNNTLVPQLVPFGDAPVDAEGLMQYRVEVSPAGVSASKYALSAAFSVVAPVDEPVCGNGVVEEGEACDDGNDIDHDGCTNACTADTCHAS